MIEALLTPPWRSTHKPISSHQAAPFLANLVACGLVGRAEAIAALLHATAPVAVSTCGRRARLSIGTDSEMQINRQTRAKAAQAVRQTLAALLPGAPSRQTLHQAASRVGRPTLAAPEISALLTDMVARHLRVQRSIAAARTGMTP